MTDNQKQCEILQQHQYLMNGKTNLTWLKTHLTYCLICQQIMNIVKESSDNVIEESGVNK